MLQSNCTMLIFVVFLFLTEVAFTAKLSADLNSKYGDTMVFDVVITNLGGVYNAKTGIFTAPKAGYYFFALVSL